MKRDIVTSSHDVLLSKDFSPEHSNLTILLYYHDNSLRTSKEFFGCCPCYLAKKQELLASLPTFHNKIFSLTTLK